MNILYFSPVSWNWIRQRPHFTVEYLSKAGHKVEFFFVGPFGRCHLISKKVGTLLIRERPVLPCSLKFPLIEWVNRYISRTFLLHEHYDTVILTNPRQLDFLPEKIRKRTPIVYDCMDIIPAFYPPGRIRNYLIAKERELCQLAIFLIASSNFIRQYLQKIVPDKDIAVVRNASAPFFAESVRKATPAGLPPGTLLYLGTIDQWLDWKLLTSFAKKHPDKTICLVGESHIKRKFLPNNILILPPIPHSQVPSYLAAANILLIPFASSPLIEGIDPVKLYEYMATGKPILSFYWKELDYFCGYSNLFFYKSPEEFEKVKEKIEENGCRQIVDSTFQKSNSWAQRMELYSGLLEQIRKNN